MIGLILAGAHRFLKTLGPVLAAAAPFLLAGVVGAFIVIYVPVVGAKAKHDRVAADRDRWRASAETWLAWGWGQHGSFLAAERLRGQERATAVAAQASAVQQCAQRVSEARQSAIAIERIVTKEPTYDENRCPVRERVDPGQLREALRPGSAPR